jgi:hypothetical protein
VRVAGKRGAPRPGLNSPRFAGGVRGGSYVRFGPAMGHLQRCSVSTGRYQRPPVNPGVEGGSVWHSIHATATATGVLRSADRADPVKVSGVRADWRGMFKGSGRSPRPHRQQRVEALNGLRIGTGLPVLSPGLRHPTFKGAVSFILLGLACALGPVPH